MRGEQALLDQLEEWGDQQSGKNSLPAEEAGQSKPPEDAIQDEPGLSGSDRSGARAQRQVSRNLVSLHQTQTRRYRMKRAVLRFFLRPFGFGKR